MALDLAGRLGGGAWQLAYWRGDADVVNSVGAAFGFFGAYFARPENERGVTRSDLVEMLNQFYSKSKRD